MVLYNQVKETKQQKPPDNIGAATFEVSRDGFILRTVKLPVSCFGAYQLRKEVQPVNDLVFLEPNKIEAVPFTTSKVIAEFSGVSHKKIKVAISNHTVDFQSFGLLAPCETESTGGRPEVIYKLNEPQATFLMTLLKNTPIVVEFKRNLVKQFYLMRAELQRRQMLRTQLKPIRRELTDVIKDKQDSGKWDYKLYTDLAYKTALGRNASQIRKDRGAGKRAAAIDYMTSDEIQAVSKLQSQVGVLLEMGMSYQQIKMLLLNRQLVGNIA